MPRSLWLCSAFSTASGMLPIPICSVAPSSTRFSAISLPIFVSTSDIACPPCSGSGISTLTAKSKCDSWMILSPNVRGICLLTWAMITFEFSRAARTQSTLVPSVQ
uniref:Putative secreted protein n=1 Tax=Anopheles darlingi TaxID=43151 RepID=A0A2M4D455_ANODA